MTAAPGTTDRTRVRRHPERAVSDINVVHSILDAGLVAHLGVTEADQPFVIPVAYARSGDRVLFHGSSGSRLMRTLAAGSPCCLTVTLLDGLVVARSAFESSMNYRSVLILGTARQLDGAEKLTALEAITEHLTPGRWQEYRSPTAKELAATLVLELTLDECSAKVRTGDPEDLPEDNAAFPDMWCGVVPITEQYGQAVTASYCEAEVPSLISTWRR